MSSNHATPTSPATRECARVRPLLPLQGHGLLGADEAERLSVHVNACQRCQAELAAYDRLDAVLRRTIAATPAMPMQAEEIMAQVEARTRTVSAPVSRATDWESVPRYRSPRPLATALGAIAALIVVALFARLLLPHGTVSTPPAGGGAGLPEPTATIHFNPDHFQLPGTVGQVVLAPTSSSERDPRVVFSNSLQMTICPSPPREVSVTWLTTGPTFGLALVEADCGGPHNFSLVDLTSQLNGMVCQSWSLTSTTGSRPTDTSAVPSGAFFSIPSWLPLPHQGYTGTAATAPPGSVAEQVYTIWLYTDQTYAAGRYVGQVYEAASAAPITVAGLAGWVTADGSSTTVTVPLAGGQTFFFSGTGSPAHIEQLAAIALAHADTLLPNVGTPTAQPGFSC